MRADILHAALYQYLYPQMALEFHTKLLEEAKDHVKLVSILIMS